MSDHVAALFEHELRRRGVLYHFDCESDRYRIQSQGLEFFVSLANLARAYRRDQDECSVAHFVDSVLSVTGERQSWADVQSSVLFSLEPSDYAEPSQLRTPISERVDRVPVQVTAPGKTLRWISSAIIETWQVSLAEVEAAACRNLGTALAHASLEYIHIDGMRLGFISSELSCKAALILAPNLREIVSPVLGWPLNAVLPDRDFLYLWAARHAGLISRVGGVVVREYTEAPYPITTEVFEIGDCGVKAIGTFMPEGTR